MKLDVNLSKAIVNLSPNSDFQVFMEYLGNYGAMLTDTAIYSDTNADTYRGMARSISEVLKAVDKAPTLNIGR